ncbi:uncharacterized protein LOC144443331 [Glandiceps talaboti]
MGNGASGHVKSIKLKQNSKAGRGLDGELTRDRRSNSDGCIVDSLSSSKSKVDMLRQQLQECEEMLKDAEERAGKAKLIEQQMAEVEGNNFELTDRVAALEHELEILKREKEELDDEDFSETLNAKDQYIEKLEKEAEDTQIEIKKLRLRMKKRMKSVQTELAEAKQESALKTYSFKQEISRLEEENSKLTQHLDRASSASKSRQALSEKKKIQEEDSEPEWEDSRTKLILELSNQVSIQDEKISELENDIATKEKLIQELQKLQPRPPSGTRKSSASRSTKDGRLTDVNRPGSGDTNSNKVRVSSGASRQSALSREDVSMAVTPDVDSGVVLDSRQSSGTSRGTPDSNGRCASEDAGDSASRRRRRDQFKVRQQSSLDNNDQKHQSQKSNNFKSIHPSESDHRKSSPYDQQTLLDSFETETEENTGGARRKTKTRKDLSYTEQDSKYNKTFDRSKQKNLPYEKSKLTTNLTDVYDLNDLLNDFDSFDTESDAIQTKKKKKKPKPLSSKQHETMYFDTNMDSDAALLEIPVP